MRDIKFRGKLINNIGDNKGNIVIQKGKWIKGYYFKQNDYNEDLTNDITKHFIKKFTHSDYDYENTYEVDSETVGQYTGLKDKNGVEIYEGDIAKIGVNKAIAKYSEYNSGFILEPLGEYYFDSPMIAHILEYDKDIEIIGNIYDNPELLEKE